MTAAERAKRAYDKRTAPKREAVRLFWENYRLQHSRQRR